MEPILFWWLSQRNPCSVSLVGFYFSLFIFCLYSSVFGISTLERDTSHEVRGFLFIFVYFCVNASSCFKLWSCLLEQCSAVHRKYLSSHPQWLMLQAFHSDPHEKAQNSQNQAWFRYKNTIIKLIFWNLSPDSVILMKIKCGPVFTLNFHLFLHFCTLKLMPSHLICPTCPKGTALNNFHNKSCASPADAKG